MQLFNVIEESKGSDKMSNTNHTTQEATLDRYQQAQAITQGILSKKLVLNDAVFPHWIESSDCFWYLRETREANESSEAAGQGPFVISDREYRLVDANAATNLPAFDHQALADALTAFSEQSVDPKNLPISDINITLSPLHIRFQSLGQYWLFEPEKNRCQAIETPQPIEGLVSPDGKKAAFVRDYNLWVRDIASGEEQRLTQDGHTDFSYASDRFPTPAIQALWSPDSQRLFTHQLDRRQVASIPFVHHVPQDGSLRPQLTEEKVSFPGDHHIETYQMVSIELASGEKLTADYRPIPLSRTAYGYFTEERLGWWSNDNQQAFFVDIERETHNVRVVEFDTASGATRILFEEPASSFAKLHLPFAEHPIVHPLVDSEELIWLSERSGYGHLYLYDLKTGDLKSAITQGEWHVQNVLHIDTQHRKLLIQTTQRNADHPFYRDSVLGEYRYRRVDCLSFWTL